MGRLTYKQLDLLKSKFNVTKLWSYSKFSTYHQCSWLYKLKYIDKIRVKGDSCYTWWGTVSHDIMQGFYEDEYKSHQEMSDEVENKVIEYQILDDKSLAFPAEEQWLHFISNIRHYFKHTDIIPYDVVNEKPVIIALDGAKEKHVFTGYIDSEHIEDDCLVITDYKTSSMSGFTGKGLLEKSKQLVLYAIGINQFGRTIDGKLVKFPIDKIKLRYDMMKYVNVRFMQKNGKEKVTKAERRLWVAHIANQIRKEFGEVEADITKIEKEITKLTKKRGAKCRTEDEIKDIDVQLGKLESESTFIKNHKLFDTIKVNEMIELAINENSLKYLPQFIQDKFTVSNCYIEIELTEEVVNHVKNEIITMLDDINEKSQGDAEENFDRGKIEQYESFYCNNLCDMKPHCKFYQAYKENEGLFRTDKEAPSDEELLAMLGL